ncbi:MAG: hypothetical protein AB7E98_05935 [Pirellulales bacterium]
MPKLKDERPGPDSVLIEVPIAEVPPATWGLHINTHLTLEQSHALRRVTAALDERLVRLSNSRRVINPCDALKYLLEQICVE